MLVHPDKNMGSPQASESFKKLQCAYEVNNFKLLNCIMRDLLLRCVVIT